MKTYYPKGCSWSYGFVSVQWSLMSIVLRSGKFLSVFYKIQVYNAAFSGPDWVNSSLMPYILNVPGPSTGTEVWYFANRWQPFQGISSGALLMPQPSQGHGGGVASYLAGWVKSVFQLEVHREQKWKQKMAMSHISLLGHESFVTAFFN